MCIEETDRNAILLQFHAFFIFQIYLHFTMGEHLKENCNAKTSLFHMKELSKYWTTICIIISLESVKPFWSYKALKSRESRSGTLLTWKISGNLLKYEAHFTESYLTSDKS